MEQFPAFVLVSCLRMKDKSEEDQARAARLFDLSLHARLLQVEYPLPALPYQKFEQWQRYLLGLSMAVFWRLSHA